MSKNVFANGREVSAKKDGNKSICAMPDVCLSPPSPPAGPIPIPYPNTSDAGKTDTASKTVKIGGQPVGKKNGSNYKKSNGDEAATKSLGMGVVTHTIQGKMKHSAWSSDVKIEGKNAIRHMDITTHNHMNTPNSGSLTLNNAKQKIAEGKPLNCEELDALNQEERGTHVPADQKDSSFTLTTASRTDRNGSTSFMKAATPKTVVDPGRENGYADTVSKDKGLVCFEGENHNPQAKNHTEPKLIEAEWQGGGSMTMKIFHQYKDKKGNVFNDSMPCGNCKKVICAAEACGLDIYLCNDENEPVSANDLCEDGEPQPVGGTGEEKNVYWGSFGL